MRALCLSTEKSISHWFTGFVNHRAKRGGSLFQGGSAEGEGAWSDPPIGGEAPQTRSRSDPYFGVGYPSVCQFFTEDLPQILTESNETLQKLCLGQAGRLGFGGFEICHRGAELLGSEGEKMAVLAIFGNLKAI